MSMMGDNTSRFMRFYDQNGRFKMYKYKFEELRTY